jgi:peptidoglycan/LPS O-acetylase OafA/YrhL
MLSLYEHGSRDKVTPRESASVLNRLFRRVTASGAYVPEIDGLRFIAITPVVAFHLWGYWGRLQQREYPFRGPVDEGLTSLIALGHYGVHLFFMISGFVLATPFCKQALGLTPAVDLRKYFWRRVTRLEPPYVVSMLVFFLASPWAGKGTWADLFPHLVASLGYVHELAYNSGSPINNNAWSLEIEVQFYLLMPVLAAMLWFPAMTRRCVAAALIVVLSTHVLWLPPAAPRTIIQYGQYFLAGILLSDLWTSGWCHKSRSRVDDLPGIIAWPAFILTNRFVGGIAADVANPWIMAALFFSALRGVWHSKVLAYGAIPLIGGMCYSIYLLHARVIALTVNAFGGFIPHTGTFWGDFSLAFLVCGTAVLLVSGFFFLVVEKPCMDSQWPKKAREWLGRLLRRRPHEIAAEAGK